MSTLGIDNLRPSAGGTSFGLDGIPKAYINFDGTVPSTTKSENVSSLTDNAAGDFTVNFTNAFADANYLAMVDGGGVGTSMSPSGSAGFSYSAQAAGGTVTLAAGSARQQQGYPANATLHDLPFHHRLYVGDLA